MKQYQKILLTTLCLVILTVTGASSGWAQEATTGADEAKSHTIDPQVFEEIGKKVRQAAEKYQSDAGEVLSKLAQRKRGFIGQVEHVTEESITVTNSKGTQMISIDETTTLLKASRKISIDDIAIDDWLVVMGLVEEDEVFTPVRILVSSSSLRPPNHIVTLGTIVDQSRTTLTLLSRQNEELSFTLNTDTEYQDQDGKIVDNNEFIQDMQVLAVGARDEDGNTATVIRSLVSLTTLQANESE